MFQLPKIRIKARFAPKNYRLEPGPLKFHSLGDVNALLVCVQTYGFQTIFCTAKYKAQASRRFEWE